ncbi:hypothetical protein AWRI1631_101070 [Saccharomyces cerevisiae AWRI1631]|uniref:Uncharacterized protein n=1 Tax=Saccharomyces cerevisiae (strain AWRI1631) TaxID=545124 RepID=B5VL81_YEAS6|nr:hypothetical protein AWRI1631_101070 [Saccharomyces cerevisiae AWRI1631]
MFSPQSASPFSPKLFQVLLQLNLLAYFGEKPLQPVF